MFFCTICAGHMAAYEKDDNFIIYAEKMQRKAYKNKVLLDMALNEIKNQI